MFFSRNFHMVFVVVLIMVLNVAFLVITRSGRKNTLKPASVQGHVLSPEEQAEEIEEQLDGVRQHDAELSDKFDLSAEEIEKASSTELVEHFVTSPMRMWFGLYGDPNIGVRRAIRGSTTLGAFVERPDVIEAIVDSNKAAITDIQKLTPANPPEESPAMPLMACDELLLYPDIFEKTKGHERELLQVLCLRYRAMVKANRQFDEDEKPFGAVLNTMASLVPRLAQAIDPSRDWDVNAMGGESVLYERAEELLQ